MITKKNLLAVLLLGFFSFFVANYALAEAGIPSAAENRERLNAGIEHTEAALKAAKQGDASGTAEHAAAAYAEVIEINSEQWGPKIQGAIGKIRIAGLKAKKGDTEKAAELLELALAKLKQIN
jgi:Small metal-binding protein